MSGPIYPPDYATLRRVAEEWGAIDDECLPKFPAHMGRLLMRLIQSHDYYAEKVARVRDIVSAGGEGLE
jgi:hypothetical protein